MVKGVDAYARVVVMGVCIGMRKQLQSDPDTERDRISEAGENVNDEASALLSNTCRQHTDFLKSGGGHGRKWQWQGSGRRDQLVKLFQHWETPVLSYHTASWICSLCISK
jgi:hypothetical protein